MPDAAPRPCWPKCAPSGGSRPSSSSRLKPSARLLTRQVDVDETMASNNVFADGWVQPPPLRKPGRACRQRGRDEVTHQLRDRHPCPKRGIRDSARFRGTAVRSAAAPRLAPAHPPRHARARLSDQSPVPPPTTESTVPDLRGQLTELLGPRDPSPRHRAVWATDHRHVLRWLHWRGHTSPRPPNATSQPTNAHCKCGYSASPHARLACRSPRSSEDLRSQGSRSTA